MAQQERRKELKHCMPKANLFVFLSPQLYTDVYVVYREMSKNQTNWPDDMETKASYLPLLIQEILDPTSNVISAHFSPLC